VILHIIAGRRGGNSPPEFRRCATRWRDIRCVMRTFNFRAIPLKTEVAESARRAAKSCASDHRAVAVDSPRGYPCRHCLRWAKPGERVILFPFAAIPPGHPYSETGPIFVHEQPCERYAATGEYPSDFRSGRVFRAY